MYQGQQPVKRTECHDHDSSVQSAPVGSDTWYVPGNLWEINVE